MKILVAGDFCPQHRVAALFEQDDYASVLGAVKPIVSEADYSIVNFECPVCKGGEVPIEKNGPNLKCTEKGIKAVTWAGFDCVTLANNHFLDYGEEGVTNTLEACKKYHIDVVGGGQNLKSASSILYKEVGAQKLAIINCCEHEFSIATENTAGSNPLNPIQQYYDIKEARSKADYVLVIVHGGIEHFQLPSPRMQEAYRFFVDAGADAVVNHHQHCFSGYELYKGKPICYGLGNFCFDKNKEMANSWYEGVMCEISFEGTTNFRMIPYQQCKIAPSVDIDMNSDILEKIASLNNTISAKGLLEIECETYLERTKMAYINSLVPYGRFVTWLRRKGLIKSTLPKRWLIAASNHINCESHLDRMRQAINSLMVKN